MSTLTVPFSPTQKKRSSRPLPSLVQPKLGDYESPDEYMTAWRAWKPRVGPEADRRMLERRSGPGLVNGYSSNEMAARSATPWQPQLSVPSAPMTGPSLAQTPQIDQDRLKWARDRADARELYRQNVAEGGVGVGFTPRGFMLPPPSLTRVEPKFQQANIDARMAADPAYAKSVADARARNDAILRPRYAPMADRLVAVRANAAEKAALRTARLSGLTPREAYLMNEMGQGDEGSVNPLALAMMGVSPEIIREMVQQQNVGRSLGTHERIAAADNEARLKETGMKTASGEKIASKADTTENKNIDLQTGLEKYRLRLMMQMERLKQKHDSAIRKGDRASAEKIALSMQKTQAEIADADRKSRLEERRIEGKTQLGIAGVEERVHNRATDIDYSTQRYKLQPDVVDPNFNNLTPTQQILRRQQFERNLPPLQSGPSLTPQSNQVPATDPASFGIGVTPQGFMNPTPNAQPTAQSTPPPAQSVGGPTLSAAPTMLGLSESWPLWTALGLGNSPTNEEIDAKASSLNLTPEDQANLDWYKQQRAQMDPNFLVPESHWLRNSLIAGAGLTGTALLPNISQGIGKAGRAVGRNYSNWLRPKGIGRFINPQKGVGGSATDWSAVAKNVKDANEASRVAELQARQRAEQMARQSAVDLSSTSATTMSENLGPSLSSSTERPPASNMKMKNGMSKALKSRAAAVERSMGSEIAGAGMGDDIGRSVLRSTVRHGASRLGSVAIGALAGGELGLSPQMLFELKAMADSAKAQEYGSQPLPSENDYQTLRQRWGTSLQDGEIARLLQEHQKWVAIGAQVKPNPVDYINSVMEKRLLSRLSGQPSGPRLSPDLFLGR